MALFLTPKTPGAVIRYAWTPEVVEGDSLSTAVLVVSAGTVVIDSYENIGDSVEAFISGGTAGETATLTGTVTTKDGETITEALYLPVAAPTNAFTYTARDICDFALRKIVGNAVDPDASELDDALERLNDMLSDWTAHGADIGISFPVNANTVFVVSDTFASAIKNNLAIEVADLYDRELSGSVVRNARNGLQVIKNALLADDRSGTVYY